MKSFNSKQIKLATLTMVLLTTSALATARHHGEEGGQKGQRSGPPTVAIEACSDLALDDVCQFEGRRGNVSGTCVLPSDNEDTLACKPEGHGDRSERPQR